MSDEIDYSDVDFDYAEASRIMRTAGFQILEPCDMCRDLYIYVDGKKRLRVGVVSYLDNVRSFIESSNDSIYLSDPIYYYITLLDKMEIGARMDDNGFYIVHEMTDG